MNEEVRKLYSKI